MGFYWNEIHTSELGILAEPQALPILPEPKVITEELAGRDGFYDFSTYNPDGRVHYMPREWEYKCSFDSTINKDVNAKVAAIVRLFSSYSGYLIDDKCKNVRWKAIVTNRVSLTQVAHTLHTFPVFIRTQPFAEGLERIEITHEVSGNGNVSIANIGTWFVRPEIYLTGVASNASIGGYGVPFNGNLDNQLSDAPELKPGENDINITGFTGTVRFEFNPLFLWGAIN